MIYDTQSLKVKYSNYANANQKISLEAKKKNLISIKRGLYSDNIAIDSPVIANICCSPSYISFEYALSYYGLIPEYVSVFTSASYGKKNNKTFICDEAVFEYRNIPDSVFCYGVTFKKNENGMTYKIATKEKALCDILYSKYPVRSIKDLLYLLFIDLRIDEETFNALDFEFIKEVAPLYHSNTLKMLLKYIGELENGFGNRRID